MAVLNNVATLVIINIPTAPLGTLLRVPENLINDKSLLKTVCFSCKLHCNTNLDVAIGIFFRVKNVQNL